MISLPTHGQQGQVVVHGVHVAKHGGVTDFDLSHMPGVVAQQVSGTDIARQPFRITYQLAADDGGVAGTALVALVPALLAACGKADAPAEPFIPSTQVMATETPPPDYPFEVACAGIGGTTVLTVTVGVEGKPTEVSRRAIDFCMACCCM